MRTIQSKKKFAARCGISVRHLERLNALGEGPPLIQLGPRRVGIADDDGDAWLASRRVALCRRDGATQRQRDPNPTGLARGAIGEIFKATTARLQ
jgi:predicted DNA-binding transcriptional regulator AlpA